ncbi:MAG: 5-formyltetrahydrofolate cyclo-ligase [Pseudomonadales bacterium]|jgi:5-formyltetrahydrofolate cyclo-ligase|nr:5-formyltetrahydrofolate cyclo-ligase [Pseudomonadales bacterium]
MTHPGTGGPRHGTAFSDKERARRCAWDRLLHAGQARPPLPPHGRIPIFVGARAAAARLFDVPCFATARCIKVNPDSPQRHVRETALARGITVLVPTPRLAGGFHLLEPERIPASAHGEAATRTTMARWSRVLPLDALPTIDAIVTGSAAATADGRRCGKGAGYSDLEWAILLELGHPPVPVGTTIHELQLLDAFPTTSNDLALHWIATPERVIEVPAPPPAARGIDWSLLDASDVDAMPVLRELRALQGRC